MDSNKTLAFLVALVFVSFFGFVSADNNANSIVSGEAILSVAGVTINHPTSAHNITLATFAGETVPVQVYFVPTESAKDVKVKVEISSGSKDYSDSYFIGNVINDSRVYQTGVMNVQLPTKLDELSENVYLRLTITADGKESYLEEYTVAVQRNSYELGLISLDYEESVSAGQTVPVSVVIRNTGFENSQDSFVVVSIPELGVSAKAYVGDLVAIESCDTDCDSEDTIQKIVNLKIPANAKEGTYSMVVRVYDDDSSKTFERTIRVGTSVDSQVIAATKSQDMRAGETKTFEMIIVNSADKVGVYNIQSTASSGMTISVPSVVTVDAGSSKLVQVSVKLSNDLAEGVYPFTVDVNGQSVVFSANVEGKSFSISGTVVLTIILLVIFVALLVVLIALLFRKDNKASSEEVETSYY